MFIDQAASDPLYYFSWVGFAMLSICIHEASHARMAVRFGDSTPAEFIPLNPVKQMGWLSMGLLCFIGIAWGKVPINPSAFTHRKELALTYLAGPLSNLGLCAVFALVAQTARLWEAPNMQQAFVYGSQINGALCLLNLLPVPPLDGFGTLESLFIKSQQVVDSLRKLSGIGLLLLFVTPIGRYLFLGGAKLAELFTALWVAPFQIFN